MNLDMYKILIFTDNSIFAEPDRKCLFCVFTFESKIDVSIK